MSAFRVPRVVSFVVDYGLGARGIGNVQARRIQLTAISLRTSARGAHTEPITKNISYISKEKLRLNTDVKTLKLDRQLARPLCIIMSWMMAKPRHLMKYADVYLDLGYDVVAVSCSPLELMWPARGSKLIAADLMKFLEVNEDHNPLVLHGFSVGAYVWAELLVRALGNLERYQPVLDRVAAQVWDSPADVDEMPVGVPLAMFPHNKLAQNALRAYARAHMKVFHRVATRHYLIGTHAYHNTPCRAPALFLLSRTDPVGAEKRSRTAHDMMTAAGIKCNWKCWDSSPHVGHYNWHPEEYLAALYSHLQECGVLRPERAQAAGGVTPREWDVMGHVTKVTEARMNKDCVA